LRVDHSAKINAATSIAEAVKKGIPGTGMTGLLPIDFEKM
jgi:hypothetical protein